MCDPPVNSQLGAEEVDDNVNHVRCAEQALSNCPDKMLVAKCATYADIYSDEQNRCDGVESAPAAKFLESDEIRVFQTISTDDGTKAVFWFEDVVSPLAERRGCRGKTGQRI